MADITIDNYSISSKWHGDVLDYEVSQNDMSDMVLTTSFNPRPIPLAGTIGSKKITLVIDFKVHNNDTADKAISDFVEYLVRKNENASYIELDLQDGFGYTCSYFSADTPSRKSSWITQCTVVLVGFRHKKLLIERTFNPVPTQDNYIANSVFGGQCRPTPLYVKYTPPSGVSSFTLRLHGSNIACDNISTYIIIDSLNGTVKYKNGDNELNAFNKTNLVVFPYYKGSGSFKWYVKNTNNNYIAGTLYLRCYPIVL